MGHFLIKLDTCTKSMRNFLVCLYFMLTPPFIDMLDYFTEIFEDPHFINSVITIPELDITEKALQ